MELCKIISISNSKFNLQKVFKELNTFGGEVVSANKIDYANVSLFEFGIGSNGGISCKLSAGDTILFCPLKHNGLGFANTIGIVIPLGKSAKQVEGITIDSKGGIEILSGDTHIEKNLLVDGDLTITGNLEVTGTLKVTGEATFEADATIMGKSFLQHTHQGNLGYPTSPPL